MTSGTNGGASGTLFYTLASTDLDLPITNWGVIATSWFGPGGEFKVTNSWDLDRHSAAIAQPYHFPMHR
jgi:hypothetical protein